MRLSELVVQSSERALGDQRADGSFPPGENGPYADVETPVRNSAHWALTLYRAYQLTGDQSFADGATRAVMYLLSPGARPFGASFHCRTNPRKDLCNGLIGQAWAIEALAGVGRTLEVPGSVETAREVFTLHPYKESWSLWSRVNVDGSHRGLDPTFNHQLWFAATGALLADVDDAIRGRIEQFLDAVDSKILRVARSGRIRHEIPHPERPRRLYTAAQHLRARARDRGLSGRMAVKEAGYQSFNLYAFAMLQRALPAHAIWRSERLGRALAYLNTASYEESLDRNPFGYPYNAPGFEMPFVIEVFADRVTWRRTPAWWLDEQIRRTFAAESGRFDLHTPDGATLTARLYEATRVTNLDVPIDLDGTPDRAPSTGR